MTDLKHHFVYRIAFDADNPGLRGKPVTFHGYTEGAHGDVKRAIVRLVSTGQEWRC
jgi:hypothetical protein